MVSMEQYSMQILTDSVNLFTINVKINKRNINTMGPISIVMTNYI